jgi:anti-sigma factor RsiW
MSCDTRLGDLSLYLYGELAAEDEERFEEHLEVCDGCRAELARAREIGRALERRAMEPSAALLAECRQELMIAVHSESSASGRVWQGVRGLFGGMFEPALGLRRLAAAAVLVTIGFAGARLSLKPTVQQPGAVIPFDNNLAPAGFAVSGIHSVADPSSGKDRIVVDGTRSEQFTGTADDARIQQYLLTAARNATNPGLRVESIGILKDHTSSDEVRRALVNALVRDPNPGVRLMALKGLKTIAGEAEVHRALTRALVADDNPGVRIQVIEILTDQKNDQDLVGTLQDLVQNEDNNYVKIRCKDALREMKASEGPF